MTTFKILIQGYAQETTDGWLASASTVLIEDSGKKIIVDPGINRQLLLDKLRQEGLKIDDIDIVFMTHYHPDHVFLSSLFDQAVIYDGNTMYKNDEEKEFEGKLPGTTIDILFTPGHAHEHASLILNTDKGVVVVAADVFWWTDAEEQKVDDVEVLVNRKDPFTKDEAALKKSRRKVLEIAEWIIPGHGKMFKSPV